MQISNQYNFQKPAGLFFKIQLQQLPGNTFQTRGYLLGTLHIVSNPLLTNFDTIVNKYIQKSAMVFFETSWNGTREQIMGQDYNVFKKVSSCHKPMGALEELDPKRAELFSRMDKLLLNRPSKNHHTEDSSTLLAQWENLWLQGNVEALGHANYEELEAAGLFDTPEGEELATLVYGDRTKKIAFKIDEALSGACHQNRLFFSVGMSHLPDVQGCGKGLINLLQEKGWNLQQINAIKMTHL